MQTVFALDDPLKRTQDEADAAAQAALGGRPRKLIPDVNTLNTMRGLAMIGATQDEAARVLGSSVRGFKQFLKDYAAAREAWEEGFAGGNASLKRKQFNQALSGDTTMLIWLGKTRLGQNERATTPASIEALSDGPADGETAAAERYAEVMNLPPSLRLIAPPPVEIDLEAADVSAEMPAKSDVPSEPGLGERQDQAGQSIDQAEPAGPGQDQDQENPFDPEGVARALHQGSNA